MNIQKTDWKRFSGDFDLLMDEKRRVQVPSSWRPDGAGHEVLLVPVPQGPNDEIYLLGLPPFEQEKVEEQIDRRLDSKEISNKQANSLRRLFFSKGQTVRLDTAGRMCIPEKLADAAGLKRDIAAVGIGRRFEIWDKDLRNLQETVDGELEIDAISDFRL